MFTDYIPLIGSLLLFIGTCFGSYKVYQSARAQNEIQRQANASGAANNRYDQIQEDLEAERKNREILNNRMEKLNERIDVMEAENTRVRAKLNAALGFIQLQQDHTRKNGVVPLEIPAILTTI